MPFNAQTLAADRANGYSDDEIASSLGDPRVAADLKNGYKLDEIAQGYKEQAIPQQVATQNMAQAGQTPVSPDAPLNNKALNMVSNAVGAATPAGAIDTLTNPTQTPVNRGLSALGLGTMLIPGFGEGEAGIKALAGGLAGAGAGTMGADAANVQNPLIRAGLQLGGSLAGAGAGGGFRPFTPNAEAQTLTAFGGKPTLAQSLPTSGIENGIGKALGAYETVGARTNPLLLGKFNTIDQANAGAVKNLAETNFGGDILQPESTVNTGNSLKNTLSDLAAKRSAAYQPTVDALAEAKGFPNYGNSLIKGLGETIDNGPRTVLDDTKEAFIDAADKALSGKTDPMDVDKALTGLRLKFAQKFAGINDPVVNGQIQGDFGYMMGKLKDAHYDALNRLSGSVDEAGNSVPGTLGDDIRAAKGDYAEASQAMNPLVKAVQSKGLAPEKIGPAVLNAGSGAVLPETQEDLARTILESAKGPEGNISAAKLGSALNKNRAVDLGKSGENLDQLQAVAKRAGQQDVGIANPSKSGAFIGTGVNLGAATQPHLWPALAANALAGTAYANAGIPLYNAARSAVLAAPGALPTGINAIPQALQVLGVQNGRN